MDWTLLQVADAIMQLLVALSVAYTVRTLREVRSDLKEEVQQQRERNLE